MLAWSERWRLRSGGGGLGGREGARWRTQRLERRGGMWPASPCGRVMGPAPGTRISVAHARGCEPPGPCRALASRPGAMAAPCFAPRPVSPCPGVARPLKRLVPWLPADRFSSVSSAGPRRPGPHTPERLGLSPAPRCFAVRLHPHGLTRCHGFSLCPARRDPRAEGVCLGKGRSSPTPRLARL